MSAPRALFFGSPAFAVPSLRAVAAGTTLAAVVSQPDRPAGRGQEPAPPAVKVAAAGLGVPVIQPETLRTPEAIAALAAFGADLFVVVAYGRILPQSVLDLPRLGAYNVHASLLPRLRGAAPIQWAIIRGDAETGVSIMRMEAGLDTGPVAARRALAIADDDTAGTLSGKLAEMGADLLAATLPAIADGRVALTPQDHAASTLAPMLSKADGHLDFNRPARVVSAHARGVDPWPGARAIIMGTLGGSPSPPATGLAGRSPAATHAILDGTPLKLFRPHVVDGSGRPGEVLGLRGEGLVIACAEGAIAFDELQLPGRKRLPSGSVLLGRPIAPGTVLT